MARDAPLKGVCCVAYKDNVRINAVQIYPISLGVPIAQAKTVSSDTALQFAGIELDSLRLEARLPLEKLIESCTLRRQFLIKRSVILHELQSLVDLLNFCCSVVVPGRAFLRHLIRDLNTRMIRPVITTSV